MAGIVGYGAFIPRNRITSEEIARQWGKDPAAIQRGLLLKEKSVPGLDEDTITLSIQDFTVGELLPAEVVLRSIQLAMDPEARAMIPRMMQ